MSTVKKKSDGSRNYRAEREYSHLFSTEGDPTRKQGLRETETMKKEYDFSRAERGKFYRKGATLRLPIYLDAKLQNQVEDLANRKGRDVGDVVNRIVEKGVRLIDELESHKET